MQYWFFPLVQLQLFVSRGQTGSLTQHVYLQHRELNREQVQAASDTLLLCNHHYCIRSVERKLSGHLKCL